MLVPNCRRKLPGMGLGGTLGYNMNILTALTELLVKISWRFNMVYISIIIHLFTAAISNSFLFDASVTWATIILEEMIFLITFPQILRDCKLNLWSNCQPRIAPPVLFLLVWQRICFAEILRRTTLLGHYLTPFHIWRHSNICKSPVIHIRSVFFIAGRYQLPWWQQNYVVSLM